MQSKPTRRRLITISASHYCEKARWALDRAGLDYREEGHLPNFHYLASFRLGGTPLVPILVEGDHVVRDSTAILKHIDGMIPPEARLFPSDTTAEDVQRLESRFDEHLGPAVRRWAYYHWFDEIHVLLQYAGHGTPRIERVLAPFLTGMMMRMTRKRLSIDRDGAEQAIGLVRRIFDEVATLLADGRPFLTGERFTAADLTFAALAAPALLPSEHGVPLPSLDESPPTLRREVAGLRKTPAGTYAYLLYAKERSKAGSDARNPQRLSKALQA